MLFGEIDTPEGRRAVQLREDQPADLELSCDMHALLGGKLSEDIAVPVDRLADAITGTREIANRHYLRSCLEAAALSS
jgi:hypothetical protein